MAIGVGDSSNFPTAAKNCSITTPTGMKRGVFRIGCRRCAGLSSPRQRSYTSRYPVPSQRSPRPPGCPPLASRSPAGRIEVGFENRRNLIGDVGRVSGVDRAQLGAAQDALCGVLGGGEHLDRFDRGVCLGDDVRSAVQNPISALISLPFKFTFDNGAPNGDANFLNIQPVYPVTVGDWNLVNRLIVPLVDAPGGVTTPGVPNPTAGGRETGLGDEGARLGLTDFGVAGQIAHQDDAVEILFIEPGAVLDFASHNFVGAIEQIDIDRR